MCARKKNLLDDVGKPITEAERMKVQTPRQAQSDENNYRYKYSWKGRQNASKSVKI